MPKFYSRVLGKYAKKNLKIGTPLNLRDVT